MMIANIFESVHFEQLTVEGNISVSEIELEFLILSSLGQFHNIISFHERNE